MLALIIPAEEYSAITPSDAANLAKPTRGLYVGVSGDLVVDSLDGNQVTFVALAAGQLHPIRCTRVYATGTTATDIVGIY
jgi:hypothetical protein